MTSSGRSNLSERLSQRERLHYIAFLVYCQGTCNRSSEFVELRIITDAIFASEVGEGNVMVSTGFVHAKRFLSPLHRAITLLGANRGESARMALADGKLSSQGKARRVLVFIPLC